MVVVEEAEEDLDAVEVGDLGFDLLFVAEETQELDGEALRVLVVFVEDEEELVAYVEVGGELGFVLVVEGGYVDEDVEGGVDEAELVRGLDDLHEADVEVVVEEELGDVFAEAVRGSVFGAPAAGATAAATASLLLVRGCYGVAEQHFG